MTEKQIEIEIKGKVSYSDTITVAQAAQIIAFLNVQGESSEGGLNPGAPLDLAGASKPKVKKVENAREAIDISGAQKNPEKIVALAAYVMEDGGETFKVEDVKTQFRRARETAPANFSRDLSIAIASGWIAEAESGEYYLTNKVARVLDGGFVFPKSANGGRARVGKKPGSKAANRPDTLADIDAFHPTMDGYPAYSKMKAEKDRMLWVVIYMRDKHDRDGLSNKEIAYISDRIGTGIPAANIGGAFRSAKTPGYAYRSTGDNSIRVSETGAAYIAGLGAKAEA